MILYNFQRTDLSKTQIGNTFAKDILLPLPKNSVLFVTSGDTTVFNVWYARYALHIRPDINIINPPKVGNNIFLDNEMNTYYKKNPHIKFDTLLAATVNNIVKKRKLYATSEQQLVPKNHILIPKGLVLEFIHKNDIPSVDTYIKEVEQNIKTYQTARLSTLNPSEQNLITTEIPMIYSNAFVRIGNFLLTEYKNPAIAAKYFQKAMWYNEENSAAYAGMALAYFDLKSQESCDKAIEYMKQAINRYFIMKKYYTKLYEFYKDCNVSQVTIDNFKTNYSVLFKTNIDEEKLQ